MISTTTAKIINILPDKFVTYVSQKIVNKYLNKYANINIVGNENLKRIKTPTIFICNHLSNSDGLVLDKALKGIELTFVAGVKLSNNAITSIGVNVIKTTTIKPNTTDKEGLKKIIKLVKQGESLVIFPEGTRSRVGSLIEAKKGILLIARMTGAPIVPIGLYGTEKLLPINKEGDMSAETFHYADVHINIGKQFEFPKREKEQDKKEYEAFAFALKWYQDIETVKLVDGKNASAYDLNRLKGMYEYLDKKGELYFIEIKEKGLWSPIGDVTFWNEDMPIIIGNKSYRGKGLGLKVVTALKNRAKSL